MTLIKQFYWNGRGEILIGVESREKREGKELGGSKCRSLKEFYYLAKSRNELTTGKGNGIKRGFF